MQCVDLEFLFHWSNWFVIVYYYNIFKQTTSVLLKSVACVDYVNVLCTQFQYHLENPFSVELEETVYSISYCPDESTSSMFGGNSNWRGPIWLCSELICCLLLVWLIRSCVTVSVVQFACQSMWYVCIVCTPWVNKKSPLFVIITLANIAQFW